MKNFNKGKVPDKKRYDISHYKNLKWTSFNINEVKFMNR